MPRFAKLVFSLTDTNLDGTAVGVRNLFSRSLPVTSRIGFADIFKREDSDSVSDAHLVKRGTMTLLAFRGVCKGRKRKAKYIIEKFEVMHRFKFNRLNTSAITTAAKQRHKHMAPKL